MLGRGAFQEMDYRALFGSTAKWATEIDDAARDPRDRPARLSHRDAGPARSGRHRAAGGRADRRSSKVADAPRVEPAAIWPGLTQMAELQKLLWAAERPIVDRRRRRLERARASAAAAALRRALRTAASSPRSAARARSTASTRITPARSASAPIPKLKARIEDGRSRAVDRRPHVARRPRRATLCSASPTPRQKLVHVHADRRRDRPQLSSRARHRRDPAGLRAALEGVQPPNAIPWGAATREARADYLAWSEQAPRRLPAGCSSAR